jgi:carboxymethylenebutenolidase
MPDVEIVVQDRTFTAYLAVPPVPGPWPGVVVLHDVLGLTPDAKGQADWLAESGYLAVAPDLYSGGGKIRCMW